MNQVSTDIGVVRNENQDRAAIWNKDNITLAVLCDGMGGHYGGSEASSLTILAFERSFEDKFDTSKVDQVSISNWFTDTVKRAKSLMNIKARQNDLFSDMGTTLTAAIINHDTKNIQIINVGDSRTYILTDTLRQITIDHNLQNYYMREHNYSLRKASKLKNAKGLVSALGPTKRTQVEAFIVAPSANAKMVVLTSDGIHDYVSEIVFEQILNDDSINLVEKEEKLIDVAKRNNSLDNLTIAIVEV